MMTAEVRVTVRKRAKRIGLVLCGAAVCACGIAFWMHWFGRQRAEERLADYGPLIRRHAEAQDLPVRLVTAVIRAESGGDPNARSDKDARGLMQVRSIAERDVHRPGDLPDGDLFDPDYNLRVGTIYLRMMVDRFGGDLHLALAAYNMGPTALRKLTREHPKLSGRQLIERHAPKATRAYCRKVLAAEGVPTTLPVSRRATR